MYLQPDSLDEALELKALHGADASALAGGTDMVVAMNHGRRPSPVLLDLGRVAGLRGGQGTEVGSFEANIELRSGFTFAEAGRLDGFGALRGAALDLGGPQIRNRATVGGNLATASPAGDGATALLALGATVTMTSAARGSRTMPLAEFFLDYRKTALAPDELLVAVEVPRPSASAWAKLGKRGAMNISVACAAAARDSAGRWTVAFGCAGPHPILAPRTSDILTQAGATPGADAIEAACVEAAAEVRPIDDFRATAAYRRAMSAAMLRRCLRSMA